MFTRTLRPDIAHDYLTPDETGQGGVNGTEAIRHIEQSLCHLESDPGETRNVACNHPEVVERLTALLEQARAEPGDSETGVEGADQCEPGRIEEVWGQLE